MIIIVFEVGKYYKHTDGTMIHILTEVKETMVYGKAMIAEQTDKEDFIPVGYDEECTINWEEITKEEFDNYYEERN